MTRGMPTFAWIVAGGLGMSVIALVGGLTTVLPASTLQRMLLPLVALAAGTLLGGAAFHIVPIAAPVIGPIAAGVWMMSGFTIFLLLEQFLHWHQSHRGQPSPRRPMTYLILIGDAAHNFLGGLGIASAFLLDPHAGMIAWLAAVAHEIPQELGDFGILVHGGWPRRTAVLLNLLSALTFPLGAVLAWAISLQFPVAGFALLSAGNFVYIAASDLIPEIKAEGRLSRALLHAGCFAVGVLAMLALALVAAA